MSEQGENVNPPITTESSPQTAAPKVDETVVPVAEVHWCEECTPSKKFTDKKKWQDHVRYHKNKNANAAKGKSEKPTKSVKVRVTEKPAEASKSQVSDAALQQVSDLVRFAKTKKEEAEKANSNISEFLPLGILAVFGLAAAALIFGGRKPAPSQSSAAPTSSKPQEQKSAPVVVAQAIPNITNNIR